MRHLLCTMIKLYLYYIYIYVVLQYLTVGKIRRVLSSPFSPPAPPPSPPERRACIRSPSSLHSPYFSQHPRANHRAVNRRGGIMVYGVNDSYLCSVLFARAPVLGLCFFVSVKRSTGHAHTHTTAEHTAAELFVSVNSQYTVHEARVDCAAHAFHSVIWPVVALLMVGGGEIHTILSLPIVFGVWHIQEGSGEFLYCPNDVQ